MTGRSDYDHVFIKNRAYLVDNLDLTRTKLGEKLVEKGVILTEQLDYIKVLIILKSDILSKKVSIYFVLLKLQNYKRSMGLMIRAQMS